MPRSKEKKKRPQPCSKEINSAVMDIIKNKLSLRHAADKYGISKSALARHVAQMKNSEAETYNYAPHYDTKKVFTEEQESILVDYMKQCAFLHYGLTVFNLRKLAYQFAKENKIKYPSKWDDEQLAGEGWARWFRSRHSAEISLRKPEATSLSRATSFNKDNVARFFTNYTTVLSRHTFDPVNIYNVDETGLSTVHTPPKILAPKGVKAVGGMTSGERGVNVTMLATVNAIGNSVPHLFVFPRVHFKDHMLKGAPPGSVGAAAPSGWSNEVVFQQYLEHFITHTKPTPKDPVLLVLDNHESHISVAAISRAKEAGVIMVTFHPHTTHKMQPLDRTVFGPFKNYYHKAMADWMVTPGNQGKPVTIYDVAELVGKAYPLSFTPSNIIKGFEITGLFPLNQNIFQDQEFLPAFVIDRPEPAETSGPALTSAQAPSPHSPEPTSSAPLETISTPQPLTPNQKYAIIMTPESIRPFPKAEARKKLSAKRCRKGKSRVLTDTPEKTEIEKMKSEKLKEKKTTLKRKKVKLNFNKLFRSKQDSSSDFIEEDLTALCNDNSDNELEDLVDEAQILAKDLEQCLNIEELKLDDFVLVEFKGLKCVKYFVAKIIEKQDKEVFVVEYLNKCLDSPRFRIEKDTEIFEVNVEDIKLRLPTPTVYGGTQRLLKQLKFPVSFAGYNLG